MVFEFERVEKQKHMPNACLVAEIAFSMLLFHTENSTAKRPR